MAMTGNQTPEEALDAEKIGSELYYWLKRKSLPSELASKLTLRWPHDVDDILGIPSATLKALRSEGDHPRLFAIGRALFTTRDDLLAWIEAHELAPGALVRPATTPKGAKRPVRKVVSAAASS
ncbi:MAG: hypothetical protein ABI601_18645 [bacterium]